MEAARRPAPFSPIGWQHGAASLTPLDRLSLVGARGMGALIYEPEVALDDRAVVKLSELAKEAAAVQLDADGVDIERLIAVGGSPKGVEVPRTRLLGGTKRHPGYFAIEHFDRRGTTRVHAHTQGTWSLSPAYDLTFAEGPGGEHTTRRGPRIPRGGAQGTPVHVGTQGTPVDVEDREETINRCVDVEGQTDTIGGCVDLHARQTRAKVRLLAPS